MLGRASVTAALMGAALIAFGLGCDGKINQCNRLIDVINKEQGPLKNLKGNDPEELKKLAETLDGVGSKVKAVELNDDKLVAFRDDYAKMAEDLAATSRETAEALASNDPKKAGEAAKKMNSFTPRETELVDNINKYCSGNP
jgi:hypothetical protein